FQRSRVVARDVLGIACGIGRNVRWRITALAEGDAAMLAAEVADLRLEAAIVPGIFVNEQHRGPAARLLEMEPGAVTCGDLGHGTGGYPGKPAQGKPRLSRLVAADLVGYHCPEARVRDV